MLLIWSLFNSVVKGSGKCTRGCGGKKTEGGYKNSTYDLAKLKRLREEEDGDT